jgi:hypothetical protein
MSMRGRLPEATFAAAAMALSLGVAAVVLRLWHASLHVPFVYSGDGLQHAAMVKGTLDHGWYLTNGDVGSPRGQNLAEYPWEPAASADLASLNVLGLGTSDPAVVANLFFLLGFPVVALTAYLVLRRLRISPTVALVSSVLYSVLPYHFLRGEGHIFLSAYYAVPLACYLVLGLLEGRALFEPRLTSRTTLTTLGLCVLVGTGGVYYAAFTIVLLLGATVFAFLVKRRARTLVAGGACALAVGGVVALQLVPVLIHRLRHGTLAASERSPFHSEFFGLKLTDLVLPLQSHRLGFLARVTREYAATTPLPSEGGPTLGAAATIGLLALLAAALGTALSGGAWRPRASLMRHSSFAALLAFLIATVGGVSALIAYLVTPQIRVWARMSIFIAFFALVAVALGLDALRTRLRTFRGGRPVFAGFLTAVLVLAVLDQTSNAFIPPYASIAEQQRSDRAFVREIERALPAQALVYQLPYVSFPENASPPGRMTDYDPFRLYLVSTRLRWSYGAVRNGPADWAGALQHRPVQAVLPGLAAVGFQGITVDRLGYEDGGARVEATIAGALGRRARSSRDGRFSFFDLRPYRERLRRSLGGAELAELRRATLDVLRLRFGDTFWGEEGDGRERWRWTNAPVSTIEIHNPSRSGQNATFSALLATGSPRATVLVSYPDGTTQYVVATAQGRPVRRTLRVPAGESSIRLSTDAAPTPPARGDPRSSLYLRVIDPDLTSPLLKQGRRHRVLQPKR